eukprot:10174174-Heterocapsa_arctica.AAC.1
MALLGSAAETLCSWTSGRRRRRHGGSTPLHREGLAGQRRRGALLVGAGPAEARGRGVEGPVPQAES